MSFIRPRNGRLIERSAGLRTELLGFLLCVTVWGAMVGLLSNTAFALLQAGFKNWAQTHPWLAACLATASLGGLLYGFLWALAHAITGSMVEVRRFNLVIPLLYTERGMEVAGIDGYHAAQDVRERLRAGLPDDWEQVVASAVGENPGRPLGGRVHEAVGGAISRTLMDALCQWCDFYLSRDSEFHGVDYRALVKRGDCETVEIVGSRGKRLHLPAKCSAELEAGPSDRFGKHTEGIRVRGDFGTMLVSFYPQWAVLGPYHGLSLKFAKERLKTGIKDLYDHDPVRRPSLWAIEVPIELRVNLQNWLKPWFFLSQRFQMMMAWISDLLDSMEENLSWEWFVEREAVRQAVREELGRLPRS